MTFPSASRVDVGNLSLGTLLGRGTHGRVVAVSGFQLDGEWVLKLYSQAVVHEVNTAMLEKVVALPSELSSEDRRWLLENTAWPAVIAEDHGIVCGFLMRRVPRAYYFRFQGSGQPGLAYIQYLIDSDSYISSLGLAVSDHDRLALLRSVASALSRLHSFGVVVGDLTPQSILFSLRPTPSCFFIDCDTVRLKGYSVLRQTETPEWDAPTSEPVATMATDAYKFGLLAIRLLARDQASRDHAALTALSPQLGGLAQLSQNPHPLRRPSLQAWIAVLRRAELAASQSARYSTSTGITRTATAGAPAYRSSSSPQPGATGQKTRSSGTLGRRGRGKRERSPARQPDDAVIRAVKSAVKPGLLTFNPPATMVQGRADRVEVGIARSIELREALTTGLRGQGKPQFEEISTSSYMGVELRGAAFEVTSFSPQEQLVAPIARWEFDVMPYRAGRQSLTLCVSLRIDSQTISGGLIAVPVLEREIQIKVDMVFGARRFVANNWQWLIATILGLGGAVAAWIALLH